MWNEANKLSMCAEQSSVIFSQFTKCSPFIIALIGLGLGPRADTLLGIMQTDRPKFNMQINKELMLRSGTKNFLSSKFSGKLWRLSHLMCAYRWPGRLTWKIKVIITATYLDKFQQYFVIFQETFRDYILEQHILWGWVSLCFVYFYVKLIRKES